MFHELAPDYMPGTEGFRVPYGGDDIRLENPCGFYKYAGYGRNFLPEWKQMATSGQP